MWLSRNAGSSRSHTIASRTGVSQVSSGGPVTPTSCMTSLSSSDGRERPGLIDVADREVDADEVGIVLGTIEVVAEHTVGLPDRFVIVESDLPLIEVGDRVGHHQGGGRQGLSGIGHAMFLQRAALR